MERLIGIVSTALVTAGLVVFADIGLTLAWKEPLSSLIGAARQGQARSQLEESRRQFKGRLGRPQSVAPDRAEEIARRRAATFRAEYLVPGEGWAEISAAAIGSYTLVEGTDSATLGRGPGHYPETELPGEGKTVAVAGHRTTYLAPFRAIEEFEAGDEIELDTPYGVFYYEVTEERVVWPSETGVVQDLNYERLVLTACHPLYSAAQRYVVFARLVAIELWPGQRVDLAASSRRSGQEQASHVTGSSAARPGPAAWIVWGLGGGAALLAAWLLWRWRRGRS